MTIALLPLRVFVRYKPPIFWIIVATLADKHANPRYADILSLLLSLSLFTILSTSTIPDRAHTITSHYMQPRYHCSTCVIVYIPQAAVIP